MKFAVMRGLGILIRAGEEMFNFGRWLTPHEVLCGEGSIGKAKDTLSPSIALAEEQ